MPDGEQQRDHRQRKRTLTGGSAVPVGHLIALPCLLGGFTLAYAVLGIDSIYLCLLLGVLLAIPAYLILRVGDHLIRRCRERRLRRPRS